MINLHIPYTICFCIIGDDVLMLYRKNPPNQFLWNGIGGKIEKKESIINALYREVHEEASIDLSTAEVVYSGIIYWNTPSKEAEGMHCFLTYPSPEYHFLGERIISEGVLSWKKIENIIDKNNTYVVSNISHFLPHMLRKAQPHMYSLLYKDDILQKMTISALPQEYMAE